VRGKENATVDGLFTFANLAALLTLTVMEIVLGVDNIVVLALVTGRLPKAQRPRAQRVGLGLAMIMRILLLLSIGIIMRMQEPLFAVFAHPVSIRELILLGGGLFLIWKSVNEIHATTEGHGGKEAHTRGATSFSGAIVQILMFDLIFSLDSVITAIGMAQQIPVMVAAIILAVLAMMTFAGPLSDFVARHPSIKLLALAFLLLIGVMLLAEGVGRHIDRGYIYFAMAFSLLLELLNLRAGHRRTAV
jgi:predicted tellurium resistance membrane protein TerC